MNSFYSILDTTLQILKEDLICSLEDTSINFTISKHCEEIFEEKKLSKNFPILFTESNLQIQEAQSTADRININKTTVGPSVQLQKSRGKEMNIKKLDRYNIRLATDFVSEIAEVRK